MLDCFYYGCHVPGAEKSTYSELQTSMTVTLEPRHATDTAVHGNQIETFSVSMPQLGNRRRNIQIYLPPFYGSSNLRYPVIYLLHGDSLFNPPTGRVGDYEIDETLDRLYQEKLMQGMIVVGIEYDPTYRWSEYTPWINSNMHDWVKANNSEAREGGEGEQFLNFILDILKPQIDSRFRTLVDKDNTMIGGFCRTALIPLYAVLTRPDIFSKAMVMSPAVWLAEDGGAWLSNNQLINYINSIDMFADVRVYLDVGTQEESGPRPNVYGQGGERITYSQAYVEGAEHLYKALLSQEIPENGLRFEVYEGAAGIRNEWAKRFDSAMLWLLQKK